MIQTLVASMIVIAEPTPQVATDAPDHTNGTFTVARGAWQAEVGVDVTTPSSGPTERIMSVHVPSTLRIGLARRVELRLFDGEPQFVRDPNDRVAGGSSFGFKIRFNDPVPGTRRPTFGIQPYISTPTVRAIRDRRDAAFGAVLLWAQPITSWMTVDVNFSLEHGLQPGTLSTFASASAQFNATDRVLPYIELYTDVPWEDESQIDFGTDAGVIFIATRRVALDIAGRATFIAPGPDYGVIAGIAVLLADGTRWRRRIDRLD